MRTFVITRDGIARIMRTYALDEAKEAPNGIAEVTKWTASDQAQVTSIREISEADIPATWSVAMRDAWEDDGVNITVNMVKARTNKISYEIRPERNARLGALDIDYMRADEAGDTVEKERIVTLKQKLRDLPATIQPDLDAITTPAELEAWEPTWPT